MNFFITDNACSRLKTLFEQEKIDANNGALKVSVDGGGCSGFMYKYDLVNNYSDQDQVILKDGIRVVIDNISKPFLDGCTLDFVEELGNSFFAVINPQATAKCGCGNSFAV